MYQPSSLNLSRRHLISLTGVTALALTVAACGGQKPSADSASPLQFMGWDFEPDTINELVSTWSKGSGTQVTVEVSPYDGFPAAIQTRLQSGAEIDVFYNRGFNAEKFVQAGWAADLSEMEGADEILNDIFPSARSKYLSTDGTLIALPYYSALHYIHYNPDFLSQAGWDHFPTTLTELYQACKDMKSKGVCDTPYAGYWLKDAAEEWFTNYLLNSGVTPFDDAGEPVFKDDPRSVEVLEWWRALMDEGLTPSSALTDDPGKLVTNMGDGTTAFLDAHHYYLASIHADQGQYAASIKQTSSGLGSGKTLQAGEVIQMGAIKDQARREQAWSLLTYYGWKDSDGKLASFAAWAKAAGLLAPYPAFFEDKDIAEAMTAHYDLADLREVFENASDPVAVRTQPWYATYAAKAGELVQQCVIGQTSAKDTVAALAEAARDAKSGDGL